MYTLEALWRHSENQGVFWGLITRVPLETLWRHSENQGVFWGLITRVPLETLWRHSGDTDTLETLCDTLASWTLYISTILSGVSPESLQIFGPLSEWYGV